LLLALGCTPDTGGGYVPLSYLQLNDLELELAVSHCGATEYPAVIGTYEVSNTIPSDTGHWQFYVGEVVVQPVTAMFDIRIRDHDEYWARLQPGESATIEIWSLSEPTPGSRIEFFVGYHFVPAADADARLATTWTTELGTELIEFVWDCG
jgi:hypothetical protein